MTKGLIIFPCELIFLNGHKLRETILQYIDLWQLGDDFKQWFEKACWGVCHTGRPYRSGISEKGY